MSVDRKSLEKRISELERLLEKSKEEAKYYQKIAESSGKRRLREIYQLSELISDRKQAEEALRENEKRYNALFTGITDAVFVHHISDDGFPGSIIETNEIACRMLGYTRDELMGMKIGDINAPESTVDARSIVKEINAGRDVLFEQTLVAKDGRRVPVEVHSQAFEFKSSTSILSTVRDITERKRTQEIMIQTEKMISVGGLAAGMAHEINNPLAGILQNVQVLRTRMSGRLTIDKTVAKECGTSIEAIRAYMEKRNYFNIIDGVMESGLRASEIVVNMLSFTRKTGDQFKPHDLSELLDKAIDLASSDYDLKKKYDFKQIEIVREYDILTPKVSCDGSMIQQVFLNLLKNGAQSMTKRERKPPRFTIRIKPDGHTAHIEIEDNGLGMDETTRKRVFEPFFTTKDVGEGAGLGLSVSYFIITENHKGAMSVESKPGKGAKFIIRL